MNMEKNRVLTLTLVSNYFVRYGTPRCNFGGLVSLKVFFFVKKNSFLYGVSLYTDMQGIDSAKLSSIIFTFFNHYKNAISSINLFSDTVFPQKYSFLNLALCTVTFVQYSISTNHKTGSLEGQNFTVFQLTDAQLYSANI